MYMGQSLPLPASCVPIPIDVFTCHFAVRALLNPTQDLVLPLSWQRLEGIPQQEYVFPPQAMRLNHGLIGQAFAYEKGSPGLENAQEMGD